MNDTRWSVSAYDNSRYVRIPKSNAYYVVCATTAVKCSTARVFHPFKIGSRRVPTATARTEWNEIENLRRLQDDSERGAGNGKRFLRPRALHAIRVPTRTRQITKHSDTDVVHVRTPAVQGRKSYRAPVACARTFRNRCKNNVTRHHTATRGNDHGACY